jgi:hypothetical protein
VNKDAELSAILKKYFEIEDAKLSEIAEEIGHTTHTAQIEASKNKILKKLELHHHAEEYIEHEVSSYREDLYLFSKRIAKNEMEISIVTKAHVMKAKQLLWRKGRKYTFSDGYLAAGGVLLGVSIPHIINLVQGSSTPNAVLLILGIVGGFLLGMGIIGKARQL